MHFKYADQDEQADQWERKSSENLKDRHSCLDEAVLSAFTRTIDPISTMHKIMQVAELSRPMTRHKKKRNRIYRQALLSAYLITGASISATISVYYSQKDNFYPIVIDTGALVSVSPILKYCVGPMSPCATTNIQGLSVMT
jgi:hypothetical protein